MCLACPLSRLWAVHIECYCAVVHIRKPSLMACILPDVFAFMLHTEFSSPSACSMDRMCKYAYVLVCICRYCISICQFKCVLISMTAKVSMACVARLDQTGSQIQVRSAVPPPMKRPPEQSHFNRSEFEVFAHRTTEPGQSGDAQGDKLLEWATNPKFRPDRIRYVKMRTMGKKAVKQLKLNIPGGVMWKVFSEPEDGCQHMVFFFRSLYDAV